VNTHFLRDVVTRSVPSNAKLVKDDVALYSAPVEYSINEVHYYDFIFYYDITYFCSHYDS